MAWIVLILSGMLEAGWALSLKASDGLQPAVAERPVRGPARRVAWAAWLRPADAPGRRRVRRLGRHRAALTAVLGVVWPRDGLRAEDRLARAHRRRRRGLNLVGAHACEWRPARARRPSGPRGRDLAARRTGALTHRASRRGRASLSATTYYFASLDELAAAAGAALADDVGRARARRSLARPPAVDRAAATRERAPRGVLVDAVLPPGDDAEVRSHYEHLLGARPAPRARGARSPAAARWSTPSSPSWSPRVGAPTSAAVTIAARRRGGRHGADRAAGAVRGDGARAPRSTAWGCDDGRPYAGGMPQRPR